MILPWQKNIDYGNTLPRSTTFAEEAAIMS